MMKYVILVVIMVLFVGVFHMLFIGFDYIFHSPDDGMVSKLSDIANETMNENYRGKTENMTNMLKDGFGICRVICVGLAIAIPVIGMIKKSSGRNYQQ